MHDIHIKKVLFSLFFASLFFALPVYASDPHLTIKDGKGYSATFVSQSEKDPIQMEAGSSKTVIVRFKNSGTKSWINDGSHFISAYTMGPRDRDSVFFGSGWVSAQQIGRMAGTIKPGATGELGIPLHAPQTPGDYTEEFHLSAEGASWVKGGYFFVKVHVVPAKTVKSSETVVVKPAPVAATAKRIMQSRKSVSGVGGDQVKLVLGYQNLGKATWGSFSLSLAEAGGATVSDVSWQSNTVALSESVAVGAEGVLRKEVLFRLPPKVGIYTLVATTKIDGLVVDTLSIPLTVTADAPADVIAPVQESDASIIMSETPRFAEEPRIRVGLWEPTESAQVVSYSDDYTVLSGGEVKGILEQGHMAVLSFSNGTYHFKGGEMEFDSPSFIRMEPVHDPHAIFTLYNWVRQVSWKGAPNFNTYRGALEYRQGEKSDAIWIVEDVLFSDYGKGIAENSNGAPIEYLKAQSVAQVSYAWAIQHTTKHGIFDVVATTADQLYLGVGSEQITPNFVAAAEAVRGYMVTYNGDVVITPYFANSDGRTRSWKEVWGGTGKPWLVSVKTEYDKGSRLLGHGVGMSQIDASQRAKNEGLDWKSLLKYYYTGTDVTLMFG